MRKVVKSYRAGSVQFSQMDDGNIILWSSDGDAVEIERADLAAVAREVTAAHVHAGRIKLDAS